MGERGERYWRPDRTEIGTASQMLLGILAAAAAQGDTGERGVDQRPGQRPIEGSYTSDAQLAEKARRDAARGHTR